MNESHLHCHRCGTPYAKLDWPRRCKPCRSEEFRRINPVAVLLQPVFHEDSDLLSLVIGQRGIKPFIGDWALIGGHVEVGEEPEAAALREFVEETGISPGANIRYMFSRAIPDGTLLTFFTNDPIDMRALENFKACRECTGIKAVKENTSLCFPTHQEAMSIWFEELNNKISRNM